MIELLRNRTNDNNYGYPGSLGNDYAPTESLSCI